LTATPTAPPFRWLLVLTIIVVVAFTILRVIAAATLDLRSDEAYYWTWTQQWVLSYLDQPPMVAWFERLGQLIFGDTAFGARFAQLIALPLIQLLLADIARRRTGNWNAALFVVLAVECALDYGLFVIVVEPSAPLLLFTSLMLWVLCRLDETMDPVWWVAVGAAGGLALLSKFTIVLLAPALLVFLVLAPRHRRWLLTRWPYLALAIAALIFSPVLLWNAQHGWVSLQYQSVRLASGQAGSLGEFLRFVIFELLFVGVVLLPATLIGGFALLIGAIRRHQAFEFAIAVAFLLPIAVFGLRSLTLQINQSWAWFLWPIGILALAVALPWTTAPRRVAALVAAIVATGFPVVAALLYHATFDHSVWFGTGDPFGQDAGYGEMANDVLELARQSDASWIATTDYRTYAELQWHIGKSMRVVQVNERARFLDFAPIMASTLGGRALYVHPLTASATLDAARAPVTTVPINWRGQLMQQVAVDQLDNFAPDLSPQPGSPMYEARP
jgi:4-amino-4-deoxy-L-arabinose transferase-like glycosyltransferase